MGRLGVISVGLIVVLAMCSFADAWFWSKPKSNVCSPNPCPFDGGCRASGSSYKCSCPSGLSPCSATVMGVYKRYDFNRHGSSEFSVGASSPVTALRFKSIYTNTFNELKAKRIPGIHNGQQDAMRHALVSYRWTKTKNAATAKSFTDAHERSSVNTFDERAMDLHNNAKGRELAQNPANRGRNDFTVIQEAYNSGLLQSAPNRSFPKRKDVV